MLNSAYINRHPPTSKRDLTPQQLARECLAETGGDLDRAVRLAGKRARGAKLRATVYEIGSALLRASAN
jgi:hypothetical protein